MNFLEQNSNQTYILNTGYRIKKKEEVKTGEHTHGFIEMVYTYAGSGVHIINGKRYTVKKGDLLFLNYNCTHAIETNGGLLLANIMFKLEYIDVNLKSGGTVFSLLDTDNFSDFQNMITTDNCKIHFSSDEREEFEMLLDRTVNEQDHPVAGSEFMMRAMLNQILVLVFRKMDFALQDKQPINSELLHFIKNNCNQPLTLKNLANNKYYTSSYLSSQFKEFTGMSFTEYVINCRIEKAKELLVTTEKSVETIMTECGFSNRTRFFKKFSDQIGVTPLKYRKMHGSQ